MNDPWQAEVSHVPKGEPVQTRYHAEWDDIQANDPPAHLAEITVEPTSTWRGIAPGGAVWLLYEPPLSAPIGPPATTTEDAVPEPTPDAEAQQDLRELRADIRGLAGDIRGEMGTMRASLGEMKGELGEFRGELRGSIGDMRGELHTEVAGLQRTALIAFGILIAVLLGAITIATRVILAAPMD